MTVRIRAAFLGILVGLSLLVAGSPALALLPAAPDPAPSETESTAPPATIDDTLDEGADDRIANRVREIFSQIDALGGVDVRVSKGVVRLSGTVADEESISQAEEIASRIRGVVTVQNDIERDVSVDSGIGGIASLQEKASDLLAMLPLIALAIGVGVAIAAVGYLLASLTGIWHRLAPNSFLAELIASAIRFAFIIGGVVIALDIIGATALLGAVLGGAGVIGIALGFAMRDTIENYVASLMLSLRQPFRANDWVVIDDQEGRVIRLTSRATIMMTLDGNHLRIPNSQVFKAVILNYTRNPQRRFEFELGIDADDDPDAARRVGRNALQALDFVLDEPKPQARTIEVGDSNIVIRYLAWIDQREADWYKAKSRAIAAVKRAVEDAGFGLPEPIYRLRFDPRTTPLPLENLAKLTGEASATEAPTREKAPEKAREKPAPPAEHHEEDVTPDDKVIHMVEAERAAKTEENDLLDHSRPVE